MEIRKPLEWHCKQMDHFVGLNFASNFNFALVGHLLKGNDKKSVDHTGVLIFPLRMCIACYVQMNKKKKIRVNMHLFKFDL